MQRHHLVLAGRPVNHDTFHLRLARKEVREGFRHFLEFGSVSRRSRELCAVKFGGVAWFCSDDTRVFFFGVKVNECYEYGRRRRGHGVRSFGLIGGMQAKARTATWLDVL